MGTFAKNDYVLSHDDDLLITKADALEVLVKEYNEKTATMKGDVIPVEITIYQDKSFTFELKSPPAAALILKAAKIPKGASESGVQIVGKITFDQAKEIGKQKMQDLNAMDEDAAAMIIAGTARSMGIEVDGMD